MSVFVDFVGLNTLVNSSFETGSFDNIISSALNEEKFQLGTKATGEIDLVASPGDGVSFSISDGGLGGGVGSVTFTYVTVGSDNDEIVRDGTLALAVTNTVTKINDFPNLNLTASGNTTNGKITITNLFAGAAGNVPINLGFGSLVGTATGMSGGQQSTLAAINIHRNGPYNFATFKQIRVHENPLTRYQRRNNLLSFSKRPEQREITDGNNNLLFVQEKFGDLVTFTEPSLVSTYHPLVYNIGTLKGEKVRSYNRFGLSFDYSNHITYFTNEELNKLLLLDDLDDEVYEQIKELYLNGALESNASEIDYFEFLRYKQDIYPRETNKYKSNIRQRTNYQNDFWRDIRSDRNRNADTGFGHSRTLSMWNLDAQTDWSTRSFVEIGVQPTSSSEGILQNKFCHFTDDLSKVTALTPAPIYNRRHTISTTSSVVAPSGIIIPETSSSGVGSLFQGDALWEAGTQAGKNPFYSSYDFFIEELRGTGKDFSIVPEFKISDHVETLLKNGNLTKLPNMLEITGGKPNFDNSNELNFYETYSTSDFLKHFAKIKEDHKDFEDPSRITLTCKALKKFLVYDSFYPQDRSVDCAAQFYDSYEKYMSFTGSEDTSIQPYLDTLFAPGVLYNTIKSGVAVDYPIVETGLSVYNATGGIAASGSMNFGGLNNAPAVGDTFTVSDGGLNGGVGQIVFTFRNAPIDDATAIRRTDGTSSENRFNTLTNLANAINSFPGLNLTAEVTPSAVDLEIKNLFVGSAGDVAITASFDPSIEASPVTILGMSGGVDGITAYLIGNSTFPKRIPFEALLEPEKYLGETSLSTNTVHPFGQYNQTASWDGKGDNLYTKMISNYLAEIPEFFLRGSQLTSIVSEEQGSDNFGVAEFDKTYAMRLKIYKTMASNTQIFDRKNTAEMGEADNYIGGYIPPQTFEKETITMYSRPTAFGPPAAGFHSGNEIHFYDSRNGINPAFTPPYYDGEAWIDFVWRSPKAGTAALSAGQQTGKFSLSEILSTVTASALRFDNILLAHQQFGTFSNAVVPNEGPYQLYQTIGNDDIPNNDFFNAAYYGQSRSFINVNSMQLFSSVNIKQSGRIISRNLENNTILNENIQQTIDANKGSTNARWVIQTKFETPILNFNNVTLTTASVNLHSAQTPRGMWHQCGVIPNNNEGIYMQIEDLPENWRKYKSNNTATVNSGWSRTGSLADLCGFSTNPVKLGQIAQGKVISEAVVAVPYIDDGGVKKFFQINNNNYQNAKRYFQALDIVNKGGNPSALGLGDPEFFEKRTGASVIDQIRKMRNYVFPPTMDFYNYPEVTPFAMYIFEFNHTLSQEDLTDIWQGLPPEIGTSFEVTEDSVSHPLLANQLLGSGEGDDRSRIGEDINTEIRWMVFKVKKRAKTNYFDKVIGKKAGYGQAAAAAGFQTNAESETAQQEQITYNWPYDFFSLVELVKIDAEIEFADIPEGKFEPKKRVVPEEVQEFAANLSRRRR